MLSSDSVVPGSPNPPLRQQFIGQNNPSVQLLAVCHHVAGRSLPIGEAGHFTVVTN
jgi:hypothetical protein